MAKQNSSIVRLTLILLVLLICCSVLVLGWLIGQMPALAAGRFGPATAQLSAAQKILYSVRLFMQQDALLKPVDPLGAPQPFEVTLGEAVGSITARLEGDQLIPSAEALQDYLVYRGYDTSIQAGRYELSSSMTAVQIAEALQDATPKQVDFVILPGWRAEEIAAALPTSGLAVTQQEFLQLVRNPPADLVPVGSNAAVLEGYLLPGVYQIDREISAHDLLALFVERFNQSVDQDLRNAVQVNGLTLDEAVALASIVQREAIVVDEQAIIASVFYNRLAQGMRLESDPTVQYACGFDASQNTWWKNPLTQADLQIDSRYNTYIYAGLPPSPISNPGLEALKAVAYPTQTGYFYFRAKCDGSGRHSFAVTYEEHLQNACP